MPPHLKPCRAPSFDRKQEASIDELDVAYVEEVLFSMYEDQNEHTFCNFNDGYMKYRRVVAQWMMDVADYFNLHPTTTHAAISYLDRLQPNDRLKRFEWQMMAICCILISGKYNECEEHLPPLHKLEEITQQVITNECVLNYELWALKRMAWKLNARTPMAFLESYIALGRSLTADIGFHRDGKPINDRSFFSPAFINQLTELATISLLDCRFKSFKASSVACAILYYAREINGINPVWHDELSEITLHDPESSRSVQGVLELLDVVTGKPHLQTPVPPHMETEIRNDAVSPATEKLYSSNSAEDDSDLSSRGFASARGSPTVEDNYVMVNNKYGKVLDHDENQIYSDLESNQATPTVTYNSQQALAQQAHLDEVQRLLPSVNM